jgi:hypothetical protein
MAMIPRTAFNGKLLIDAASAKDVLYSIDPAARGRLKRLKKGFDQVRNELQVSLPEYAAQLGLGPDVQKRIAGHVDSIDKLTPIRDDAQELARAADASIAFHEDAIEAEIGVVSESVKRRKRKEPEISVPFEKTLKYQALYADKAVATRRKKEKAAAEEAVAAKAKRKGKGKAKVGNKEVKGEEKSDKSG